MPDLAAIRARHDALKQDPFFATGKRLVREIIAIEKQYVADVAALLAALDAKAQKEAGETCSDCPPAEYPTDKTRCDECPRRAQKEADRG